MGKEQVVDCLELIARSAAEDRAGRKDKNVLPEPAEEQAVDYLAVSEQWKEEKAGMLRPIQTSGQEGD